MKIYCATGNPGKLREFRLAGELLGIDIEPLAGSERDCAAGRKRRDLRRKRAPQSRLLQPICAGPAVRGRFGTRGGCAGRRAGRLFGALCGPRTRPIEANNGCCSNGWAIIRIGRARFVCVIALAEGGEVRADIPRRSGRRILHAGARAGRLRLRSALSTTRRLAARSAKWTGRRSSTSAIADKALAGVAEISGACVCHS